jgi:hypothetical protein
MPRPNRESTSKTTRKSPATEGTNGALGGTTTTARPAREGAPRRNGMVSVLVPLAHSCGVIRITSETAGGELVAGHYLLRVIGASKFALTKFKAEGGGTYVVAFGPDGGFCGCEDYRRRGGPCEHQEALTALVAQGKV